MADAGGAGDEFEAPQQSGCTACLLDALGHVHRHADERQRLAVAATLHHAARQHVAPGAIAAEVARLHVGGPVRRECGVGRGQHLRQIVGVYQRTQLVDRNAFWPLRDLQHAVSLLVVVHALSLQVVAPDRDATEVDRQRELRFQLTGRLRQSERLGVIH